MTKYKSKWKPHNLNIEFWDEVLLGKTIMEVNYNTEGVKSVVLDNGEEIFFTAEGGKFYIKAPMDNPLIEGGQVQLAEGVPEYLKVE